jgi:3-oxo-5alpha-steroid 4-dehydrogenase
VPEHWDERADVVIVGFGAAGACAAIEAAGAGADVLVLDRFGGGGATALSGGVVYAGGGTSAQLEAGVSDTAEAMYDYLSGEVGDAVSPATLRRFCTDSPAMIAWLTALGVPFEGSLCPYKTSYPTNRHYLYYSGSELSGGAPAPRGHRTRGRGTSGALFHTRLAAAARARGVRVLPQTSAVRLCADGTGRVTGVECRTLRAAPLWARAAHRALHRWSVKPGLYVPALGRALHRPVAALERRYGRPVRVAAARGVVLCAGGFVLNRRMLREHAPAYRGGLPLGTPGDDGSGIRLGVEAGAATGRLDRVTIWRFLTPPAALLRGVLVDGAGRRICDESRYGAAIGDAVLRGERARAWLLVDSSVLADARRELRAQTLWFQRLQAWSLLAFDRVSAATVPGVAARAGVDPRGLAATIAAYNAAAGVPDPLGKPSELVRSLDQPPYSLIDCSIRPRPLQPAPMMTLGGLVVAEESGQARRSDGTVVPGLYAAGRTAVGISSNSYVSGLSLADCVFSGRRAGRHAATSWAQARTVTVDKED